MCGCIPPKQNVADMLVLCFFFNSFKKTYLIDASSQDYIWTLSYPFISNCVRLGWKTYFYSSNSLVSLCRTCTMYDCSWPLIFVVSFFVYTKESIILEYFSAFKLWVVLNLMPLSSAMTAAFTKLILLSVIS